jgi:hypothetical protein
MAQADGLRSADEVFTDGQEFKIVNTPYISFTFPSNKAVAFTR